VPWGGSRIRPEDVSDRIIPGPVSGDAPPEQLAGYAYDKTKKCSPGARSSEPTQQRSPRAPVGGYEREDAEVRLACRVSWLRLRSQTRALEASRWMVRATNTGVTAAIDERGRVVARLPEYEVGTLYADVVPREGETPYAFCGNLPAILLAALIAAWARFMPPRKTTKMAAFAISP